MSNDDDDAVLQDLYDRVDLILHQMTKNAEEDDEQRELRYGAESIKKKIREQPPENRINFYNAWITLTRDPRLKSVPEEWDYQQDYLMKNGKFDPGPIKRFQVSGEFTHETVLKCSFIIAGKDRDDAIKRAEKKMKWFLWDAEDAKIGPPARPLKNCKQPDGVIRWTTEIPKDHDWWDYEIEDAEEIK